MVFSRLTIIFVLLSLTLMSPLGCKSSIYGSYGTTLWYCNGVENGILKPQLIIQSNGEYHYVMKYKRNVFSKSKEQEDTIIGTWTMVSDSIKLKPALWGGVIFVFQRKIILPNSGSNEKQRAFLKKRLLKSN